MKEILDLNPKIQILESEYKRLLGYPADYKLSGRSLQLKKRTEKWYSTHGRPWIYARKADSLQLLDSTFKINGIEFDSKKVRDSFQKAECKESFIVAVSAGRECEKQARIFWQEAKPDEYFFMEMYGSAVVEHLVTSIGARFCSWADEHSLAILPHYSPGYSGWNVSDQNLLMDVIKQGSQTDHLKNLDVMHSGMLNPKKSLLAVFGITAKMDNIQNLRGMVPCENCALPGCVYRRKPYKRGMVHIEDVIKLKARQNTTAEAGVILNRQASYSASPKALKKWMESRLKINENLNGTYDINFRYEGSTCSNMGKPLAYDYFISLGPESEGFKILSAHCTPARGNNGYTFMCEYRRNAKTLVRAISEEQPLLGRPLNDVLNWEHTSKHSGCYCDQASRNHKWRLVYEVIHYALAQNAVLSE